MSSSSPFSRLSPYVFSLMSGVRRALGFEAWRVLPGNFFKALTRKHLHFCLKAGIAAVLSNYMADWAGLEHGLWAPMSALIVMQVQISASLEASLMRLLGTIVGGGMGLLAFWLMYSLQLGIVPAVFFVGVVGAFLQVWDARFRLAGITAVLVLLLGGAQFSSTYTFAVDRVLEMSMGIMSALVVSVVLWPRSITQDLISSLAKQCTQGADKLHDLTAAFVQDGASLPSSFLDPFMDAVSANAAAYDKVREYEAYYARVTFPHLLLQLRMLDRVRLHLAAMLEAVQRPRTGLPTPRLVPEVLALSAAVAGALQGLGNTVAGGGPSQVPVWAAVAALRTRLGMLRRAGVFSVCPEETVVRLFAFYHALCRVGEEVARMQTHEQHRAARARRQQSASVAAPASNAIPISDVVPASGPVSNATPASGPAPAASAVASAALPAGKAA